MISDKQIKKLAEEALKGTDRFLVEIMVKPGNKIMVFVDSDTQVTVDHCVELSRAIEGNLDRDDEDFELMVSSAGLDHPFTSIRQYKKYLNKNIEIHLPEGKKFTALLTGVDEDGLTFRKLIKKHKSKQAVEGPEESLAFNELKETKPAVQFSK